jgi:hypothetical protein
MPNWCNNSVEITHKDPAMIERVRKGFNGEGLFAELIPCPKELSDTVSGFMGEDKREAHEAQQKANLEKYGYANWYDYCVNEWGTKWDVGADGNPAMDIPGGLMLGFESAWSPPIGAYEKLTEMGFHIKAKYYEPGMAFAGIWEDGNDEFYDYSGLDSAGIAEELPAELDEAFCISESVADWEEENQEIDLDGGLSAVNEQEQNENK